jgi:ATP-dependent DNA ligase
LPRCARSSPIASPSTATSRVARLADETPAMFAAFDLLREDDRALTALPLSERRARLERFAAPFPPAGPLRLSPASTDPEQVISWLRRGGSALDGVVAKRLDAPYAAGKRDAAVKIKQQRTADCVIGGYRPLNDAPDRVGSLLLGLYDDAGLLDYVGFCSAFDSAERRALMERLTPLRGGSGFTGGAPSEERSRWQRAGRDRAWVPLAPELVLEVAFDQVTAGHIRHGTRPLRWRTDKAPRQCAREQLAVHGDVLGLLA